ncbi:ATP-dependent RNA helicase [Fistulina hepatica ATCC 64428]|nr:ATP-dependent RNA helicase [Fistulina hepatica ATCC 64428]
MDADPQCEIAQIILQLVHPSAETGDKVLQDLELARIPSPDRVHHEIEQKILLPRERLPAHWLPKYQIQWNNELSIPALLQWKPMPAPTKLSFVRSGLDGRVTGYAETPNPRASSGLTSMSLERAPGPSKNFVRGKSGYVPFWPGGLDNAMFESKLPDFDLQGLRTIAPGLSRGLQLPGEDNIADLLGEIGHFSSTAGEQDNDVQPAFPVDDTQMQSQDEANEIDNLLPTTRENLNPTGAKLFKRSSQRKQVKRDWAHVVDINKPITDFHERIPEMARNYPFELDTFQKQAVYHLEMGDSVFVAAHTSAGKTVVAEYAIALAEKHMTRAIYTSPIKALSNQKFRDFKQTFFSASVGILTGDVQINPEASCLIMTTEILRSMLYKGADLIRDVEFVIFDEVHYVNDAERGVVWEEVIIMLPDHISIILLSATVPNTKEFADWVGRTKKKDIYVITTAQRPVPLEHYLYAGREIYKIVDAKRNFLSQGYKGAGEAVRRKQDKEREAAGLSPVQRVGARGAAANRGGGRGAPRARGAVVPARGRGGGAGSNPRTIHTAGDKNLYVHLVGYLRKHGLLPVVIFTFSKKRCEENAATLTNADLCTSVEKSEVHVAIEKALTRLRGSDKRLPQITRMRDLLSRGIGVHHGGLLPIVKELVEILFARGLVKVLFATETFAMGVNMPTKCVVFSHIRKHDGRSFRDLLPGEYTQMAGRAGRRGLDTTGTVIIVVNDSLPEQQTLHQMMLGKPGNLTSQFRLTYNMILNLLRVEALRVEEMIKRSFSENASQRLLPDQQMQVVEQEKLLSSLPTLQCDLCQDDIEVYYDKCFDIAAHNVRLLSLAVEKPQGLKILAAGRVLILRDSAYFKSSAVGVLLKPCKTLPGSSDRTRYYWVLAVVNRNEKESSSHKSKKRLSSSTFYAYANNYPGADQEPLPPVWPIKVTSVVVEDADYDLKAVPLSAITLVTSRTIKVDQDRIVERHSFAPMRSALASLSTLIDSWATSEDVVPEVDWSRIRNMDFQETLRARNKISRTLDSYVCLTCDDFEKHYKETHKLKCLLANIAYLKLALSDQNLELIPDYEQRVEVLKELKFIDDNSTVLLKGRVACEINSANELVLTELILENTLANYEPEEVVALLSCFVFSEKTGVEPALPPRLQEGRDAIIAIAEHVGRVQDRHKVPVEDFRSKLKFGLAEVVYEWAKGMPFEQITGLTDVPEGTIVRVITRLDETCREVRDAARVIGDAALFKKMEESQVKIKRDIVFAASLYF